MDTYRACASIVLLRPSNVCSPAGCGTAYQVLLLQKPRKRDTWQLPQGGVEAGETTEQAALRELQEEAGISGVKVVGKSSEVYQYEFPASYRRFRPDNVRGQRIEYVFAVVENDPVVTVDQKEIENFAWVDPSQLHLYIKRRQYLECAKARIQEALVVLGGRSGAS